MERAQGCKLAIPRADYLKHGTEALSRPASFPAVFGIAPRPDIPVNPACRIHKLLEEEGKRVINLLPKMEPGKQRGKPVPVRYTIPINFQVQN